MARWFPVRRACKGRSAVQKSIGKRRQAAEATRNRSIKREREEARCWRKKRVTRHKLVPDSCLFFFLSNFT